MNFKWYTQSDINNKIDNQNTQHKMKFNSRSNDLFSKSHYSPRKKIFFLLLLPSWRPLLGTINDFFSSSFLFYFWFNFNFFIYFNKRKIKEIFGITRWRWLLLNRVILENRMRCSLISLMCFVLFIWQVRERMYEWMSVSRVVHTFFAESRVVFVVCYYVGVSINKYNSIDTWVRWGVLEK